MEDRRRARIGTVSGLALLTGATALVAVGGGHHSIFATLLLGLLAAGMAHALVTEIQRQARRRSAGGWSRPDTVNSVLLACWSLSATAVMPFATGPVRLLALLLAVGYAASCAYFVVERRRAVASAVVPSPSPPSDPVVVPSPSPSADPAVLP